MTEDIVFYKRLVLAGFSLITIYFSIKERRKLLLFISTIFGIGFFVTISANSLLITTGFLLMILSTILVILYAIVANNLSPIQRLNFILTGTIILLGNIFSIEHWAYYNHIETLSILPLITFFLTQLFSRYKLKSELFTNLILVLAGISRFINGWN